MYGRKRDQSSGQLALLDAVVFFVIAIAISSMTIYHARQEVVHIMPLSPDGQSDPEAVLQVFLHASLGEEVVLELDRQIHVTAGSDISACLQTELDVLSNGANVEDFVTMNQKLLEILETICTPVLDPYLVAIWLQDEGNKMILSLPGEPRSSGTQYSSSAQLNGSDGSSFLLILVLLPSALPEIVEVGAGHLDLGSCICQSSAHLKP